MQEAFIDWTPQSKSALLVSRAAAICADEKERGYDLTLRQLFHRMVEAGHIEPQSYDILGTILSKAKLAGRFDWDYLPDRATKLSGPEHPARVEVWLEKDALLPQVIAAAEPWGVPVLPTRGFLTTSAMYDASKRAPAHIIHVSDADDSGHNQTADIKARLEMFGEEPDVTRIITKGAGEIDLEELDPESLEGHIRHCLEALLGKPTVVLLDGGYPGELEHLRGTSDAIYRVMDETADTTRAVALKRKIEAILSA